MFPRREKDWISTVWCATWIYQNSWSSLIHQEQAPWASHNVWLQYLVLSSHVMFCCWKNLCCYLTSHTEWHWLSHQRLRSFLMEHPRLILFLMLLSHLPPQCPINDYIRTSLCPKSRSLVNKFSRFQCSYSSTFDVICITKTWLTNFICDKEILPKVYTLYRKNRVTRGGGVLIAVNMRLSIYLELISAPASY